MFRKITCDHSKKYERTKTQTLFLFRKNTVGNEGKTYKYCLFFLKTKLILPYCYYRGNKTWVINDERTRFLAWEVRHYFRLLMPTPG